jgi:hypothetical protein
MSRADPSTFRTATGAGYRLVQVAASQPSWVTRAAILSAGAVVAAIALLLIIPAVLIGLAVFFAAAATVGVHRWFRQQRSPNGMLDGRRNVRVVLPRSE